MLAAITAGGPAAAQQDPVNRLREALRRATVEGQAATQQLGQAQAQLAQAQAALAAREVEAKTAAAEAKQLQAELKAATLRETALQGRLSGTETTLGATRTNLEATQRTLAETQADLAKTEATRAATKASLEQEGKLRLACEDTNARLYAVGQEVLALYAGKTPLAAIAQREPFTQLKAVQIETIVQDYRDKLRDEKLRPRAP